MVRKIIPAAVDVQLSVNGWADLDRGDTGNGYGGLRFSPDTWRAYGGSGMAHNASREEQIRIAERVRADVGWGAWPACSRKLGLR